MAAFSPAARLRVHRAKMKQHRLEAIDLVAVNFYPFEQTVAQEGVTLEDAIENIDIGGPALVRAAAKNYADVVVIVDPADYAAIVQELDANRRRDLGRHAMASGAQSLRPRRRLRLRDRELPGRARRRAAGAARRDFFDLARTRAEAALRREPASGGRALRRLSQDRRATPRPRAFVQQRDGHRLGDRSDARLRRLSSRRWSRS